MNTPIVDFLKKYSESGTARFHMPGHKGRGAFARDITEIKGADELYRADGIIDESERGATSLFGTAHSYYSTARPHFVDHKLPHNMCFRQTR